GSGRGTGRASIDEHAACRGGGPSLCEHWHGPSSAWRIDREAGSGESTRQPLGSAVRREAPPEDGARSAHDGDGAQLGRELGSTAGLLTTRSRDSPSRTLFTHRSPRPSVDVTPAIEPELARAI